MIAEIVHGKKRNLHRVMDIVIKQFRAYAGYDGPICVYTDNEIILKSCEMEVVY